MRLTPRPVSALLALWTFLALWMPVRPAAGAPPPTLAAYGQGLKPESWSSEGGLVPRVELNGSRGEILNFLLRSHTAGRGCFSLDTQPWQRVPGTPAAGALLPVRYFDVLPFVTRHASVHGARVGAYPDPLIETDRFCGTSLIGTSAHWILGELEIPQDLPPGAYESSIILTPSKAGRPSVTLPIRLKVWPMVIPEKPAVPLYSELTSWFVVLGHYGKWHAGEAALSAAYTRSMLRHRIVPYKNWVKPVTIEGGQPLLGKSDSGVAPDSYYSTVVEPLPPWAYLSVPFPSFGSSSGAEEYFRILQNGFDREGWASRAFLYLWDEPQPQDLDKLRELALAARKGAPGFKILVTIEPRAGLEKLIDIFVPVMDHFDRAGFAPPGVYRDLQAAGKEVWLYASCMSHGCTNDVDSGAPDWVIDRPGASIRSQAWIASRYGVNALLYYAVVNGYQSFRNGRDPWTDLWDFTGNGDGTLYYPGRPGLHGLTQHQPVESLRLKLWRQSSYDAEYVRWLNEAREKPPWWPGALQSLVRSPRSFERTERPYQQLRDRIGDYLADTGAGAVAR